MYELFSGLDMLRYFIEGLLSFGVRLNDWMKLVGISLSIMYDN